MFHDIVSLQYTKPGLKCKGPLFPGEEWAAGVVGYFGFQVTGMIEGYFGFEIFDSGIFLAGKIGQVFFWVAVAGFK